jgi:hypothetical protein
VRLAYKKRIIPVLTQKRLVMIASLFVIVVTIVPTNAPWISKMKEYSVPVIHTTVGWITIQANDMAEAQVKAAKMNDEGVELLSLEDSSSESEVLFGEIKEFGK